MHYGIELKDILHEHLSIDDSKISHRTNTNKAKYTSYYSEDIIGDDILLLDNLSEKKKLNIWKNTSTKDEIVEFFPNMEMMKSVFNNKIEDNGKFKTYFLEYMEEEHLKYIAGEISSKEFKESILNPHSSLTDSW
jgi:hypothetical protein